MSTPKSRGTKHKVFPALQKVGGGAYPPVHPGIYAHGLWVSVGLCLTLP